MARGGAKLTTLGVPCIYYGTEQAFDGSEDSHGFGIEPARSFEDRYIRESMFGGTFGAFKTRGCHFFTVDASLQPPDDDSPIRSYGKGLTPKDKI